MRATLGHEATSSVGVNSTAPSTEKPAVPVPFRLASYFVQRDFPAHRTIQKAEWVSADKEVLEKRLAPLRSEGIVTDSFLLVDTTIQGNDARKIRQAAARYGADVVLIVDGVAAVDRFNNGYASLYPTLIGAYFAPGTESQALFMIEGAVWDVRTERLYATRATEGQANTVGTAIAVEDRQVLDRAKKVALDEFGKRMADELRRLKDATPRGRERLR
jgi:rhombotail lipoprotein